MRILGIDPGYGILGWSIIEKNLVMVQCGTITTEKDSPLDERLMDIHTGLKHIIDLYQPGHAAMEKLFFSRNTTTALDVAKTMGVVILTLKLAGLDCCEYTPAQVKQAVTGYGRASKEQMQSMVKKLFRLREIPRPDDAADALAVAACHSFRL